MDHPRQRAGAGINGFNFELPTFNSERLREQGIQRPTKKVRREITRRLNAIEAEHDVRVLWAVESGSRAWGFASPDSDYDVRFIYAHRADWYLAIHEGRDVIELPLEGNLDISGWDLRKALRLFCKSNPVLMEWIASPLVYRRRGPFVTKLRALADRHFSRRAAAYHYLHMAQGNYRAYLSGRKTVKLKKYLYVLRPLAAILWLIQRDGLPPMSFVETLDGVTVPARTRSAIQRLLKRKSMSSEMRTSKPIAAIDEFIAQTMEPAKEYAASAPVGRPPVEKVDPLFRSVLKAPW